LSLVDQLREIDVILTATPPQAPKPDDPSFALFQANQAFLKFRTDPWTATPTADDIQKAFAALNMPLGTSQGAIEGTPFFPEAAIINGLTDFVINRAKDEVSITFLIDLRDRLSRDPLLKLLFSQTLVVVGQLEASSAKQLLGQLRAAVTADIRAIPRTLLRQDSTAIDALQKDLASHLGSDAERTGLDAVIKSFKADGDFDKLRMSIAAYLHQNGDRAELEGAIKAFIGGNAIDALWMDIDAHLEKADEKLKLKNAIRVLKANRASINLLAKALQDMVNGVPAMTTLSGYADLTPDDLARPREVRYALITVGTVAREYRWAPIQTRQMLTDPVERTRFLALLSRDLKNSQAAGADCPPPALDSEACDVKQWTDRVKDVEVRVNDVVAAIDVTVHAVEALRGSLSGANTSNSEALADVANAALQILAATRPFATGNDKLTTEWDSLAAKITHINKLQVSIVGRDYITAITEANLVLTDFDVSISLPSSLLKPLAFAAALASAKTSQDVTSAIETAAVPVLSFRVKRTRTTGEGNTWVGVNAYVGGSIGLEHISQAHSNSVGFGGLSVPIGAEVGWPLGNGGGVDSISIFVPLIDVGTVASFRFKSPDTDQQPALTFSQIVAPGAFAVFGITQKYPVSIGVGAQFVPKLRRPAGGGNGLFDAIRYGAFVAIDVPIFRF
jgi:hypothetical protein